MRTVRGYQVYWYLDISNILNLTYRYLTCGIELKACESKHWHMYIINYNYLSILLTFFSIEIKILPSGMMYLACAGTIESRITWMPTLDALDSTAAHSKSTHDYLATYDIHTGKITKLDVRGMVDPRGLNLHGMDVVPDEKDPDTLWIYLVNHRPPLDPTYIGANSVIEVFKSTQLGMGHVDWVQTVEDHTVVVTPNDIVGSPNGQEFWFTNDNSVKTGMVCVLVRYVLSYINNIALSGAI